MITSDLPAGLVTFLFTDIEDSTRLWERHGEGMGLALAEHDQLLKTAVQQHDGIIVKSTGDGAYAVFTSASAAIEAALAVQRSLRGQTWSMITPDRIRARMGVHSGEAERREGDYFGTTLNIAARLMSAGHGGQVLVSESTAALARLPQKYVLQKLGRYHLKGIREPRPILQLNGADLPASFPPLKAQNTAARNLPGQTTPFVGRRQELQEIRRLLLQTEARLLTLVAPGGMGKTRLAIAAVEAIAAANDDLFPDGVAFVSLAAVENPASVGQTIADALGYSLPGDDNAPNRQLLPLISDKRMLLLLDNLEQLIGDELAAFLEAVLGAAPALKLLATSRERVYLRAETVFTLGGLNERENMEVAPVPAAGEASDAVQLFLHSARRMVPGFMLTEKNVHPIQAICRLTGGMPLGIELAAGWLGVLAPHEIASELQTSLDLLSTTMRDVPQRQRSLRAVFDGSWDRLTEQEQEAFLRLSVFRGGFERQEGQAATAVSLPTLLALVNKSFLQREAGGRFNLHEQMRYFANELLRDHEQQWREAKWRHSDAYAAFVSERLRRLRGPAQKAARAEIQNDFDNIRLSWEWLVLQGAFADLTHKLLPGLHNVAISQMRFVELQGLLDSALEKLADQDGYRKTAYYVILKTAAVDLHFNELWHLPFVYPDGKALLQGLWPAALEHRQEMAAWFDLFLVHHILNVGEDAARRVWEEHIDDLRGQADDWRLAHSLLWFAFALRITEIDRIRPYDDMQEANSLFASTGDTFNIAFTLQLLGWMSDWRGEHRRALDYMRQSEQMLVGEGLDLRRGRFIHEMQTAAMKGGRPREGFAYLAEEQAIYRQHNRLDRLKSSLSWESVMASRFSSLAHAFRTREESMALGQRIARSLGQEEADHLNWDYFELGELYRLRGDFARAQGHYKMARDAFRSTGDATGRVWTRRGLGDLALAEGHFGQAETHFQSCLATARETNNYFLEAVALVGLARALRGLERFEDSAQTVREALAKANNPAFIDFILWPMVALAELKMSQEEYGESALLAAYILRHPLAWLEMRNLMEDLLQKMRPHMSNGFNTETAAVEAEQTLIPDLGLTHLRALER